MRFLKVAVLLLLQAACTGQGKTSEKINGVSFVASREQAAQGHVDAIKNVNANHAAVMPFGFIRDINSPEIVFDTERQWFGETKAGAGQYIDQLQKNGIAVMLKPQLWIWRGEFTGTLAMQSEEDWQQLERAYDAFILTFAKLAQEKNVALFCIGTELELFVENRPDYWKKLIENIRTIYTGKLTYAANWDEYGRTPFWSQLDFIGIDAYFPLSDAKIPSVQTLKKGWQPWKSKIRTLSKKMERPVVFTEYGYRSMNYTAKKPWLVDHKEEQVSLEAQANALEAILSEFWEEEWFAGGYVWKWFIDYETAGGKDDNRFTPQNKPGEGILRTFYADR